MTEKTMTRVEFVTALAVLQAGIGREFTKQQNEAFWECLKDLPAESLKYAVKRYLCEVCSGFPSIADLRKFAAEHQNGLQDLAGEAWESATKAVRRFGSYRKVDGMDSLDNRTRMAIEHCGGWNWLCDVSADNRSILSAQFRRAYDAMSERENVQERLPVELRPQRKNPALELSKNLRIAE
jgi:hypothetical protein